MFRGSVVLVLLALMGGAIAASGSGNEWVDDFSMDSIANGPWEVEAYLGGYTVVDGELVLHGGSESSWAFAEALHLVNASEAPIRLEVMARDDAPAKFRMGLAHEEDGDVPAVALDWRAANPSVNLVRVTDWNADTRWATTAFSSLAEDISGLHRYIITLCYDGGAIGEIQSAGRLTLTRRSVSDAFFGPADVTSVSLFVENHYSGAFSYAIQEVRLSRGDDAGECVPFDKTSPHVELIQPTNGTHIGLKANALGLEADVRAFADHPENSTFLMGEGEVIAEAWDDESGLDHVAFLWDGQMKHIAHAPPFVWSWDTSNETMGRHSLQVTAVDRNGNAASATRDVFVISHHP